MTIIPIFRGELSAAARQGKLQSERAFFSGQLLLMVAGSFAAWYFWSDGELTSSTMARIANEALRWSIAFHAGLIGMVAIRGARTIAKERDRRTLDFLLVTRLNSAEIVLGKLAASVLIASGTMLAGFPVMLLLHVLAGVELPLILIIYAGMASTIVFLGAGSVWVSTESSDARTAVGLFLLGTVGWMVGPFFVTIFLPRWGIRLPEWLASANWTLVASSPISVAFHIATGLRSWDQLVDQIGRLIALQLGGAAFFTVAAIIRLRPAHRALGGVDRKAERRARRGLSWRLRPRPPVGDDAIFWRERYTSRENVLVKAATSLIFGSLLVGLAAATFYYARPAFIELWQNGYGSASVAVPDPEMNILVRLFAPRPGGNVAVDIARTEFNLFIRYATVAILAVMSFVIGGMASEVFGIERLKETWTSLLTTPLTARDLVRSALRTTAWKTRFACSPILIMWAVGTLAGAIHPMGLLVSLLALAASVWLMAVCGVFGSIHSGKAESSASQVVLLILILTFTGILPLLLPPGLNPVLLGAGSLPLMAWTSLVSYREVSTALSAPLDPHFHWVGLYGGQMPMLVALAWLVAIVGPSLAGFLVWRYMMTHFDRLVGRPFRVPETAESDAPGELPAPAIPKHTPTASRRGSPLAEADRAV